MTTTIERTKVAVARKQYDFTALWAILVTISPELINALVEILGYLTSEADIPHVPETWKPYMRLAGFLLALWARSIVARAPKGQDSVGLRAGDP